jgi:hypothetical protein
VNEKDKWRLTMDIKTAVIVIMLLVLPWQVFGFDNQYKMWNEMLSAHVNNGLVDYAAIKENPGNLDMFVTQAGAVTEAEFNTWTEPQQLAFLINLYNAVTIQLIISEYPVSSIRDIGGLLKNPWKLKTVPLFREMISLDNLEHDIIRKRYDDPRIHFALVNATLGCPNLRSEAYLPDILDEQLEEQTTIFLQESFEKNRYEIDFQVLYLSPIFKWNAKDFKRVGGVREFVRKYIPDITEDIKIHYTAYNWSLNDLQQ